MNPLSNNIAAIVPTPSERFQRLIAFATDEADGLGHASVTCQHLLYALSYESKGLASVILEHFGITPQSLKLVLAQSDASHDRMQEFPIDMATETRDALKRAVATAREWEHRWLDTEHILYSIAVTATSADEMFASHHVKPLDVLYRLIELQNSTPESALRDAAALTFRFTIESAWLFSCASDEARRNGWRQVTALHLLVALVTIQGTVQHLVHDSFGLNDVVIRKYLFTGASVSQVTRLPLAEDLQHLLGNAIGEAWNRGHLAVTPLHLALGIANSVDAPVIDILNEIGISSSEFYAVIEAAMPPRVSN